MRRMMLAATALLPLATGGCLVRTAADVAMVPVKATGKVVDWSTTSPREADRNYAHKMRKQEKRCQKHPDECPQGQGQGQGSGQGPGPGDPYQGRR
jgi:hypothetical protein